MPLPMPLPPGAGVRARLGDALGGALPSLLPPVVLLVTAGAAYGLLGLPTASAGAADDPVPAPARAVAVAQPEPPLVLAVPPPPVDPALRAAVERIPGYAAAPPVRWELTEQPHLGSTLLETQLVTISPRVPASRLDDVVRHEWAHVVQARTYGGDVAALVAGLTPAFGDGGPRGLDGVERAADCMARELGATWTHYSACDEPHRRAAARVLLTGQRL